MTIRHRIEQGERLTDIASQYGVEVSDILAANPKRARMTLPSGSQVFASLAAGEQIADPGGAGTLGATGDSCSSDDDCNGGTCIAGFCLGGGSTTAASGTANAGDPCVDGAGNAGTYDANGICQAPQQPSGSNSIVGNLICPNCW